MATNRTHTPRRSSGATQQATQHNDNTHAQTLSDSLERLSLTQVPPSSFPPSPISPALGRPDQVRSVSYSRPSPNPLRRSSSSMSIDRREHSPALLRKISTASLRNGEIPKSPSSGPRRSSSAISPHPSSLLAIPMEEPSPPSAASIANDWFEQELRTHGNTSVAKVNTVVILHDDCYGHRFSRPKTSKSTLSLIFERPERIQASVMGISAAYVRLGQRHAGGLHAPDPRRQPPGHVPFKIIKTRRSLPLNSPAVTFVHGTKWMEELNIMCHAAGGKLAGSAREVERPPKQKNEKEKPALHTGDLYLCPESLAAFEGALGGVCDGVDAVFEGTRTGAGPSTAFVCVRPPGHHCSSDYPSGFCWLNNVHVGIQHAVQAHGLTHAAIIDFDLHHGDGSQAITWAHNTKIAALPKNTPNAKKTSIGYFSIHDINSYPCEYGDVEKIQMASICVENAHGQSIWNVHLQPWKTEQEFWDLYQTRYLVLVEKARCFLRHHTARLLSAPNQPQPKAAIFFSAGFDASEHETDSMQRHKVNVPTDFYARFTRDVVAVAKEEGTGVEGRVISVLEGGYSDKALISGVFAHVSGLCDQDEPFIKQEPEQDGTVSARMLNSLSGLATTESSHPESRSHALELKCDPEWWHSNELDILVSLLNPSATLPAVLLKKSRAGAYSSPTHASTMKKVDPTKLHRTLSGRFSNSLSPSRAASPPPPEVDWATAARELCKVLVPSDRQTGSCTVAELAGTRAQKKRNSLMGLPTAVPAPASRAASRAAVPVGMQLRGRNARGPKLSTPDSEEDSKSTRSVSITERRKTIAAAEIISDSMEDPLPTERMGRLSIGSTFSIGSATPSVSARPAKAVATAGGIQIKKIRGASAAPSSRVPPGRGTEDNTQPSSEGGVKSKESGVGGETSKLAVEPTRVKLTAKETCGDVETLKSTAGPTRIKLIVRSADKNAATIASASKVSTKKPLGRPPKAVPAGKKSTAKGKRSTLLASSDNASKDGPVLKPSFPIPNSLAEQTNLSEPLTSGLQGLALERNDSPVGFVTAPVDEPTQTNDPFLVPVSQEQLASQFQTHGISNGQLHLPSTAKYPENTLSPTIKGIVGEFEEDPLSSQTHVNKKWVASPNDIQWISPATVPINKPEMQQPSSSSSSSKISTSTSNFHGSLVVPASAQIVLTPSEPLQTVLPPLEATVSETNPREQSQQRPVTPRKAPVFTSDGFIPFSPTKNGHAVGLLTTSPTQNERDRDHIREEQ